MKDYDTEIREAEKLKTNMYALLVCLFYNKTSEESLRIMGIAPRKPNKHKDSWSKEKYDQLLEMRNVKHMTFNEIGEVYGVHATSVRERYINECRRRGIEVIDTRKHPIRKRKKKGEEE